MTPKRLLTTIAALLLLHSLHAQQLQASLSHFTTDNGLSSNAIANIYQDSYGFVWLATWNGLSRFDGYNFYNYRTGNGSKIKNLHNRIYDLAIDQAQNIWMRMYDNRVFVLDRNTDQIVDPFEAISGHENFMASAPVLVTSTGDVLVAMGDDGLYALHTDRSGIKAEKVDTRGQRIVSMAEGFQDDTWLATANGILRLDHTTMKIEQRVVLSGENISCIYSNGFNVYAATASGAIYTFGSAPEPKQIRRPSGAAGTAGTAVITLFVDSHGMLWFCDDRMGASRINPKTGEERFYTQTVLVPEYDGAGGGFSESNGTVWMRMNHGGYGYYNREADRVEYFHNDPANPWNLSNTVQASLELPEGVIWESTSRRGLEKLEILKNNIVRKRLVENARTSLENEVRAMYYDSQRQLTLIGNKSSTLFIYAKDSTRTTITHDDQGHPFGRIYGITKDSKGNYWICSKGNGLFKMQARPGGGWTIANYAHQEGDKWSLNSNNTYQAVEDKSGNIWVATYGKGVNLLTRDKDGKEVFLNCDNAMAGYPDDAYRKVRTLALDQKGNIWAGTTDGILIMTYKDGKFNIEKVANPENIDHYLMSTDIVCLACDAEGSIWVGTNGGGISHTVGQDANGNWQFDTFDARNGLPSEEIRSITFDKWGNVWFGADHIICSYDVKKGFFTTFTSLDGVDETLLSEGGAVTLDDGSILFGTLNGYYVVDRRKLMATTGAQLKLRITDFFLNGEIQSPRLGNNFEVYPPEAKTIHIPQRNAIIGFRFAALNYQLQHRVQYQYMLEGYDKDWQTADKDRMAIYADLPGGTYHFKVKAFLMESPEKYDMRTVEVVVPVSPFVTTTAFIIYLLIIAAVFILLALFNKKFRRKLGIGRKEKMDAPLLDDFDDQADDYEVISRNKTDEQ